MSKADVLVGGLIRLKAERKDCGKPYFAPKHGSPAKTWIGAGYSPFPKELEVWAPDDIDRLIESVKAHVEELEALL